MMIAVTMTMIYQYVTKTIFSMNLSDG